VDEVDVVEVTVGGGGDGEVEVVVVGGQDSDTLTTPAGRFSVEIGAPGASE
jgi:hypothetical protein